jgi:multiple sugar transport system permease protein
MTSATVTGPIAGTKAPGLRVGRVLLYVALCLGALVMITPFVWMVLTAFKSDLEIAKFS